MKKGDIIEGVIENVTFPNKGIVREGGTPVTVKNGIPGQRVRAQINKKRKDRMEARLLEVLEKSPLEVRDPVCRNFPACGGCMYQTMSYESQLEMKKQQISELLGAAIEKINETRGTDIRFDEIFEGILPSPSEFAYRNKMEFAFGDAEKGGPMTLGLHKKGSTYDILTTEDCRLVHPDMDLVLQSVLEYFREKKIPFYHKMSHEGYLRHLLVRRSQSSGEMLVDLVTTGEQEAGLDPAGMKLMLEEFVYHLLRLNLEGKITGILHTTNNSVADVVKNEHTEILYGQSWFVEEVLGMKFRVTPFSFFQTNSRGAAVLYETARRFLGDTRHKTVFDLYSGTGTIAQILAPVSGKVIGVELVEEAVDAARENARMNGLDNCEFIAGDVLKVIDEIEDRPDVIVLDPPREGIHPKALPKIISYGVNRIVYISCKPTSLARDLEILCAGGYVPERICCVDMFPQTVHVETVCLLSNRKPDARSRIDVKLEDY